MLLSALAVTGTLRAQLAPAPPADRPMSSPAPRADAATAALVPVPSPVRGRYLDAVATVIRATTTRGAGRRITLAVDITPKPAMRVYAPGNIGYAAVALTVTPAAGLTSAATAYPKADDYLFAPLNERVKVYSAAFRLTRDVTLTAGPASALAPGAPPGLVIAGQLEYQACDDRVCYLPQTLPLTWTVPQ